MPFYTANNTELKLNGTGYYVSDVSLSSSADINPVKKIGSNLSDEYSSAGRVNGSLSINYFLSGEDPIKNLIENDESVSGNFCGLYFDSGHLTSYSLNYGPNQPVSVSASFSFFSQVSGSFSKTSSNLDDVNILNVGDFRFSETGVVNGEKILSLSYSFNNSIQPFYAIQETGENPVPIRVSSTSKSVSMQLETNDYSINIPSTGLLCRAAMSMRDNSGVEQERYEVSGVINSEDMSVTAGELLVKNLSVTQANLAIQPPEITSITPSSAETGAHVVVSGSNLSNVESVSLQGQDLSFDTPTGTTGFGVTIPTNVPIGGVFGGPLQVRTRGGLALSTGALLIS